MVWISLIIALVLASCLSSRRNRALEEEILTVLLRYGEMPCLEIEEKLRQDFARQWISFTGIYILLHRLESQGLVISRWGEMQVEVRDGARRKYYRRSGARIKLRDRTTSSNQNSIVKTA